MEFKFVKKNIESAKGRQPSKADALLEYFTQPGDVLYFNEEDMTRQKASNIAKRLKNISGKPFHSFYDTVEKAVAIRLRKDGELSSSDSEDEE